jgi:hypothetical protein
VLKLNLKAALNHSIYRILVLAVSIACGGTVYFLLTRIDLIVHGQLYSYGLVFNAEWADPYRVLMWSIYGCLLAPVALSGAALVLGLIKQKQELPAKPQQVAPISVPTRAAIKIEKSSKPTQELPMLSQGRAHGFEQRVQEKAKLETPPPEDQSVPEVDLEVKVEPRKEPQILTRAELRDKGKATDMIISCPKCKKTFHRPLVMLDFSGAKPRLVNVCPFCNHILGSSDPEMGVYNSVEVKDELVKHGDY